MRETKRELMWYEFYQDVEIAEHLERMAAKGWRLEKTGMLWRYRRAEPQRVRYAVTYFSESSEFNPAPTEDEETLRDYCAAAGWEFVAGFHQMQIFSTARADAPPIETEGAVKLEAVHRAMKKNFLPGNIVLLTLFGIDLALVLAVSSGNLAQFLSDGRQMSVILLLLLLMGYYASNLISYWLWYRASRQSVERGGPCAERWSRFGRGRQIVLLVLTLATALFLYLPATLRYGHGSFGRTFIYMCNYGIVTAFLLGLRNWLKRRYTGAWQNRLITIGAAFALRAVLSTAIPSVLLRAQETGWFGQEKAETYVTSHGTEWELHHDPIPLKVEDLMDTEYPHWSYELREYWSPLATRREGRQINYDSWESLSCDSWESLSYEIFDVKVGFLLQPCLNEYLRPAKPPAGIPKIAFPEMVFRKADPAPWGAEAAWQYDFGGTMLNRYLLCKGSRIVRIDFDWVPTAKQMETAGRVLLGTK